MYYLITFTESDGNDCTVYDAIREAKDEPSAVEALAVEMEQTFIDNGTPYEPDGSELGFFFNCPDDCESLSNDNYEPCGLHSGGVCLREVLAFDTEAAAEAAHSYYHSRY